MSSQCGKNHLPWQLTTWLLTYLLTYSLTNSLTHSLTHSLPHSLTHSKEQSSSWEANRFSASQEITHILWNLKVHYCMHKWRHLSLSWARSIQFMPPTHFLKIHRNVILTSTSGSSEWSLSLRFRHQNPVYASPLPHMCYLLRPSHTSQFDHPNNIWSGVQIIKLHIM
jgi:hypothetical protein